MDLLLRAEQPTVGGDALAREPSGRVVFVTGAIPGELVRVRLTNVKKDFARGHVVEVLEASADRTAPPCPYVAAGCGGCGWQHIGLERQRSLKVEVVADAFRRTARLPEAVIVAGDPLPGERFRTTLRLAVGPGGVVGFRSSRSNRVVPVDDCLVAHPRLAELLADLRCDRVDELVLRVSDSTGERLAHWSGSGRVHGLPSDVATGDDAFVTQHIGDAPLRVSARSFFQSSAVAATALVAEVTRAGAELLSGEHGPVVDAYGGVGLFARCAVGSAASGALLEGAPSSCSDARENLRGRGMTVVEGPVEEWEATPAALVIADPARAGLGRAAAERLAATGCERLVLVSCDAAAGARDVRLLVDAGLRHVRSTVLDPFPHTAHVEVVTVLARSARDEAG